MQGIRKKYGTDKENLILKKADQLYKLLIGLLKLVGTSELESPTPTMSRWCSNQLSYAPVAEGAKYT